MTESLAVRPSAHPQTELDDLDAAVTAWWASNPAWTSIAEYKAGEVLFCTAEPVRVFYGRRDGSKTIQIADDGFVDASLESPWMGPEPIAFAEVPEEVAIVYMMQ